MKKTIMILGSNGFVGRNLKEWFSNDCRYQLLCPSHAELDLLNEASVKAFLQQYRPDVVINAAVCRNPLFFKTESPGSELEQDLRMFYILEKHHALYGKMLYFGSGAEFDKRFSIASVAEDAFTNEVPTTEYGLAKYVIGKSIEASTNIYNLRIFGLFGKYENWKTTFISGACCKALKDIPISIRQNVIFDYLFIDDFCRIVHWFVDNKPKYHTYHVASGRKIDLLTLANAVKTISGHDVPIIVCHPGMGNEYTADVKRLAAENMNFHITPLEESSQSLLAYYKGIIDRIDLLSLLYP